MYEFSIILPVFDQRDWSVIIAVLLVSFFEDRNHFCSF